MAHAEATVRLKTRFELSEENDHEEDELPSGDEPTPEELFIGEESEPEPEPEDGGQGDGLFFVSGEPIPEELHSEYEERPFRTCTRCGETLADFEEGFQISKVFRRGEAVFEFALCGPCRCSLHEEFSTETKERLERFAAENANTQLGLEACAICEERREDLPETEEFQVTGLCSGDLMFQGLMECSALYGEDTGTDFRKDPRHLAAVHRRKFSRRPGGRPAQPDQGASLLIANLGR